MDLLREDVMKMKVAELKMALQHRGAPASGVKAVLLERLLGLMENDKISDKPSSPQGLQSSSEGDQDNNQSPSSFEPIIDMNSKHDEFRGCDASPKKCDSEEEPGHEESEEQEHSPEREEVSFYEEVTETIESSPAEVRTKASSTCNVRIDNFQRPFTIRSLREWLEEKCGLTIDDSHLWLNGIKTHCYVTFHSAADAEKCKAVVHGLRFPSSNSSTLEATLVDMSALDATSAPEAALRLQEWKQWQMKTLAPKESDYTLSTSSSTCTPLAVETVETSAPGTALGKRKLVTPTGGGMFGVMRNTLAAAAVGGGGGVSKVPRMAQPIQKVGNGSVTGGDITELGSVDGGFTTRRPSRGDLIPDSKAISAETTPDDALDKLFRKTDALPQLYWLPLTSQQVERRRVKTTE